MSLLHNGTFPSLVAVNASQFLAQAAQLSLFPAGLALWLRAEGWQAGSIGVAAGLPWLAMLGTFRLIPGVIDRLGYARTGTLGLALASAALCAVPWSSHPAWVASCCVALGVGIGLRWIALDAWLFLAASDRARGRLIGFNEALMGLSLAAGAGILALLPTGTSAALWVAAAISCGSVIVNLAVAELPQGCEKPRPGRVRLIPPALGAVGGIALVSGALETAAPSMLPLYSSAVGQEAPGSAALIAAFALGATAFPLVLGWLADRHGAHPVLALALAGCTLAAILLALCIRSPAAVALLFCVGGVLGSAYTLATLAAAEIVDPQLDIVRRLVFITSGYTLGGTLGGPVTGAAMDYLTVHAFPVLIAAGSAVMSGIAWKAARRQMAPSR